MRLYLASLLYIFMPNAVAYKCPLNGLLSLDSNKCYHFFSVEQDFLKANRTCQEQGGSLVSICNALENLQIKDEASDIFLQYGVKDFWIGLNDLTQTGIWNWTNPTMNGCKYTNWMSGNPGVGDCTSMAIANGQWQTSDCSFPKSFVCEVAIPQPSRPQCPPGYTYYQTWNYCYKYVTTNYNYADAQQNCINDGGDLVSIHSQDEEKFIDTLINNATSAPWGNDVHGVWIGFHNPSGQLWQWTDDTPVTYVNWRTDGNYPHNYSNTHCAYRVVKGNSQCNSIPCWDNYEDCVAEKWPYVCKQDPSCY